MTFSNERAILSSAGDPQLLAISGGTTLLYYGENVEGKGFGILVARATADPVSGEGAPTTKAKAKTATKTKAKKAKAKKAAKRKPAPAKKPAPRT